MSGAAVITPSVTFGGQVGSISLGLLDTNFTQITAFLNNPNNYTNYLVDTGAANSYVVTFSTGLTPTYTAGLAVVMKVTNANTGASQINVNSLGLKNITKQGTVALSAGDMPANSVVLLVYDGTQFQLFSGAGINASNVGYTPAGTGAVATTVQSKLRQLVTPEDFGAVGDGTTDDGPAFVLACNYCSTTGATLWMQPKVYKNARVEMHGTYSVVGNGATVMFLGMGQTIIAGTGSSTAAVPTPWPTDPGYYPTYPATTKYSLSVAPAVGDTSITLSSVSGISVDMYLFIAGNPSSASSTNNFIPQDFEFIRVTGVVGSVVSLASALQSSYLTTQSGVFYTPGLAVDCVVSGLKINTTTDAYQYVVRSSVNCKIENIDFIGASACGASTFSDNLEMNHIRVSGAYDCMSTARGTVSTYFNNVQWNRISTSSASPGNQAVFIEESFYKVALTNYVGNGGGFSIRSVDMSTGQRPRLITVDSCMFDASTAYGGSYSPFFVGSCLGADIICSDSVFKGSLQTPNSGLYPSINGTALIWQSGSLSTDSTNFYGCKFIASTSGPTWPLAANGSFGGIGGFQGNIEFDAGCTFVTCYNAYYRPWIATLIGSTAAPTTPVTVTGYYTKEGKKISVWCDFQSKNTTGATGNVQITGLPYQSATSAGGNFVGTCVTAGLGGVATVSLVAPTDTKIQILNGTAWSFLPMVAATGKYLTCNVSYIAS
jgi:hypothetical protein